MNQISLITQLVYQQQRQELINELAGYRLMKEAMGGKKVDRIASSKLLTRVGKLLQSMGLALEERYGRRTDMSSPCIQEYSQGDCA